MMFDKERIERYQMFLSGLDKAEKNTEEKVRIFETHFRTISVFYRYERITSNFTDVQYYDMIRKLLEQIFMICSYNSERDMIIERVLDQFEDVDELIDILEILVRPDGSLRVVKVHQQYSYYLEEFLLSDMNK